MNKEKHRKFFDKYYAQFSIILISQTLLGLPSMVIGDQTNYLWGCLVYVLSNIILFGSIIYMSWLDNV